MPDMLFEKFWRGQCRVFSRDILKWGNIGVRAGGRGGLGVYYLVENIIHYYYCQSEGGGRQQSRGGRFTPFRPSPPLEPFCYSKEQFLTSPEKTSSEERHLIGVAR